MPWARDAWLRWRSSGEPTNGIEQQQDEPSRRSWNIAWLPVGITLGAATGFAVAWALQSADLRQFASWLDAIQDLLLAAICGFGVAVLLGVPIGYWLLKQFVGAAEGALTKIISDATAAAEAATERNAQAAMMHAGRALREAAAWYGPRAARRFVVQTALGLLVTFGGLVGTGLLFRQTLLLGVQNELLVDQNRKIDHQVELLTDQNRKIDLQTVTAEAQRRGGLSSELFSIMQLVTAGEPKEPLTQPLIARLVAFTRAARPYFIVLVPDDESKAPYRDSRPLSPERGQLLVGLVLAGVNIEPLVDAGATFEAADLFGTNLSHAGLSRTNLSDARLNSANLEGAKLISAKLNNADLRGAYLYGTDLSAADLPAANLSGTNLQGANLSGTDLYRANLSRALLPGTKLAHAKLQNINLSGAKLYSADLSDSDLSEANLAGADLSGSDLSKAHLAGANLSGADLSGADLRTATGLTQVQLDEACGNPIGLPDGLTLDKPCPGHPGIVPPTRR